ncbi:Gfo/Idh/MocA family oxidoreductase [Priestia megaterium]
MLKNKVRCAVLGLGRLGRVHAANIAGKIKGAELVAVSDVMPGVAEQFAREFGVKYWSNNPDEIIQLDDIDAIIIVTPTSTHANFSRKVAQSGKALFLEKPISTNITEARETADIIMKSGIVCQLGFMRRFDPAYMYAKEKILAGDIGTPLYFKGITRDPFVAHEEYVASCGGIFMDLNIHDFDVARYLLSQEIVEVNAMGSVLSSPIVAKYNDVDQALTYLRFDGGAAGDVEGYRNAVYGYDIRAEIIGTEGTVVVAGLRNHSVTFLGPNQGNFDVIPFFMERFEIAYLREMEHFIECIQKGIVPSVSINDGLIAQEIANAAKSSCELGQKVNLSRSPQKQEL